MGLPSLSRKSFSPRFLAFGLVLWLGGVGCLAGCAKLIAAAPASETTAAGQSDPHACCRRLSRQKPRNATAEKALPPASAMVCCPLAGHAAALRGKPRLLDAPMLAPAAVTLPVLIPSATSSAPSVRQAQVPDRGGTYLRNRSLLI